MKNFSLFSCKFPKKGGETPALCHATTVQLVYTLPIKCYPPSLVS